MDSALLTISAFVIILIAVVLFFTGGVIPGIMVLGVAGFILFLLNMFGNFDIKMTQNGLEIDFHENAPTGHNSSPTITPYIKEVFHVSDNLYSYDEAAAVCAANGAELASFDQIQEAFSLGAEWCSYGWSAGAMALYPTQQSTWSALQGELQESKRTACGRPGVNGGYFDPKLKFGVNCYGIKPKNHGMKFPQPLPTDDPKSFDRMVDKFKKMLPMKLTGFNRDIWSEAGIPGQMKKDTSAVADSIDNDISSIWKSLY